jgi:hypothetical protein
VDRGLGLILKNLKSQLKMCWYTSVIPPLRRLRQEDHEFKASLKQRDPAKNKNKKQMIFY